MGIDIAALDTAGRDELLEHWRSLIGRPPPKHISRSLLIQIIAFELQSKQHRGAVRQTSPSISIRFDGYFYEITKERHSVRAASRFSLKVLRFESDLCELNRL